MGRFFGGLRRNIFMVAVNEHGAAAKL